MACRGLCPTRAKCAFVVAVCGCYAFHLINRASLEPSTKVFQPVDSGIVSRQLDGDKYDAVTDSASNISQEDGSRGNRSGIGIESTVSYNKSSNPSEGKNDLNCDVHLASNGSLPFIALASSPGSGNTWVRYLLEQATGIYTGSVYHDKKLERGGFLGEMLDRKTGRTIVIKTHIRRRTRGTDSFTSAIVLIRNPFRAIISHYNFKESSGHQGIADWNITMETSEHWHNSSQNSLIWWRDVTKFWLKYYGKPILVVHYEDLVNDTISEVTRMLDFLHVPQKERRMDCVRRNLEGKFHRHSNVDEKLQFAAFTPEMRREITNVTDWASRLLVRKGFKPIHGLEELELRP